MTYKNIKISKKGDVKFSLTKGQLDDFIGLMDDIEDTKPVVTADNLALLIGVVKDRLVRKYISMPYEAQTIAVKIEEAIILHLWYSASKAEYQLLASIMMDIDQHLTNLRNG